MVFLPSLGIALGPPELDISSLPIFSLPAEAHLKLDKHLFSWKPERNGNCLQARGGGGGEVEYRQAVSENSFIHSAIHSWVFFFLFEKGTHYDCVVLASLELAFLF